MNSYLLNQVLEKARRLQPAQLSYDSTPKVVSVAVEKFVYEHKTYSNHRYEHRVAPDYLKMAPSHAKEAWSRGEVTIVDHGACDCFRFPNGLMAYKSWVSAAEEFPQGSLDTIWVRVRCTKFVPLGIPGLDPYKSIFRKVPQSAEDALAGTSTELGQMSKPLRYEFADFYLQYGYARRLNVSLESEDPSYATHRGSLEIRVPQAVVAEVKA